MQSKKQRTENGNVLDLAKLINMPLKHTKDTFLRTEISETSEKSILKNFPILISSVQDFLVSHSLSLDIGEVSQIREARCFLKLCEYLKLKDLRIFSLKTSRAYSVTMKGKLLEQSSVKWKDWGIVLNGFCLTARISKHLKAERECSLSEVLERNVKAKYYLSEKTLKGLMQRIRKGWNFSMTETIKAKESILYQELVLQFPQAKQEEIIFRLLQKYIRRLTPVECERLQGFPDDWTSGVAETQRYSQCGNAVNCRVVEEIIKSWKKET